MDGGGDGRTTLLLIVSDGRAAEPEPGDATPESSDRTVGAQLVGIAVLCACCWLAIGLLVAATLMLGHGWLEPLLIAAALVVGAGLALLPAALYRERARDAESALQALIAEAPDQALLDARAREPRLYLRGGRFGKRPGPWRPRS
jgi:hypothetical protein